MLRLDPNNLPPHLQAQIHKKLGQWQERSKERSKVELKPQKHEMVIAPKKVNLSIVKKFCKAFEENKAQFFV